MSGLLAVSAPSIVIKPKSSLANPHRTASNPTDHMTLHHTAQHLTTIAQPDALYSTASDRFIPSHPIPSRQIASQCIVPYRITSRPNPSPTPGPSPTPDPTPDPTPSLLHHFMPLHPAASYPMPASSYLHYSYPPLPFSHRIPLSFTTQHHIRWGLAISLVSTYPRSFPQPPSKRLNGSSAVAKVMAPPFRSYVSPTQTHHPVLSWACGSHASRRMAHAHPSLGTHHLGSIRCGVRALLT